MISPEHQSLIDRCQVLLKNWEAEKARLERTARVDKLIHLPHTADAEECSALAIKGCIGGLMDALKAVASESPSSL